MVLAEVPKKLPRLLPNEEPAVCPLIRIVQQYGLLEAIVSNLFPDDLLALALSSKSIYNAISPRSGSLENLLGRLSCPGRGIEIRNRCHRKSTFFYAYECHEFIRCGGTRGVREIESRPCAGCKVTTCDECRIHCVYQSICEKPCDPDDLHNFSGFVLLSPFEVPILSPHHLAFDLPPQGKPWQDPAKGQGGPYHDQGFLDVPFEDDAFGPPEFVEDVLNLNLGQHSLRSSISSNVPDPSPVLKAFYLITEQRKRYFCNFCVPTTLKKHCEGNQDKICECTLRGRFLSRWLCLRCYEAEEAAIVKAYPIHQEECHCAQGDELTICLWCNGVVSEHEEVENTDLDVPTNTLVN